MKTLFSPLSPVLILLFGLLFSLEALGQKSYRDSLQQLSQSLIEAQQDSFKLQEYNLPQRDLGGIDATDFSWEERFRLKSQERSRDNIGGRGRSKLYFHIYAYESLRDRQYALQCWMDNFIEDGRVRAGRTTRSLEGAKPTVILINDRAIITLNMDCKYYFRDSFERWRDQLMEHFAQEETMVLELFCDGPLEWTHNATDPKTRGLF